MNPSPLNPDQTAPVAGAAVGAATGAGEAGRMAEQMAQMAASIRQLQAVVAQFPAIVAHAVGEALKHPALKPSTEVGIAGLVPLLPPGMRSRSSIRRRRKDGTFPGRKVGRTWAFDPEEVLKAIDPTAGRNAVLAILNVKKRPRSKPRVIASPNQQAA